MKWTDTLDIAIELAERHPEMKLEAIQLAWMEESD